jgi:acyl-CoA thioesterase
MKPEMKPPEECSGSRTYANATWRDMQGKESRWYEIRPEVDCFMVVKLHNHAQDKVTGTGNFATREAAQAWMEKTIAP